MGCSYELISRLVPGVEADKNLDHKQSAGDQGQGSTFRFPTLIFHGQKISDALAKVTADDDQGCILLYDATGTNIVSVRNKLQQRNHDDGVRPRCKPIAVADTDSHYEQKKASPDAAKPN